MGCERDKSPQTLELEIVSVFEAKNSQASNMCVGEYNGTIYYAQIFEDHFGIQFHDMTGKTVNRFDIKRGKGPGELMYILSAYISGDTFYINDLMMKRINMYSIDGKYIETIQSNPETGIMVGSAIIGNDLYFQSIQNIFFGKMNITTGLIEASIPHTKNGPPENNGLIEAATIRYDRFADRFYLGHLDMPYRIDVYSKDMKKISEITAPVSGDQQPLKWFIEGEMSKVIGSAMISSLTYDERFIYAPVQSNQFDIKNNSFIFGKFKTGVNVFDKKTGTLRYILENKRFREIEGEFSVVGVTSENIILQVVDTNAVIKDLLNDQSRGNGEETAVIVVCKKPKELTK